MEKEENDKIDIQDFPGKENEDLWFLALAADDTHPYDTAKAFDRFKKRSGVSRSRFFHLHSYWSAAAVVLLLLCVSAVSYWQGGKRLDHLFSDIVIEAPLGSKNKMTLPDGTVVWLNAGSQLKYSQGFGVNDRIVSLVGEAYFEVAKNPEKAFVVNTNELDVTVLGTKFNFRNYPDDREATVDLMEGRVSLNNRLKQMEAQFLSPTEKMVLNKQTGAFNKSVAKVEHAKDWTQEVLFFDEDLLFDIAKELERSYNVSIRIEDDSLNTFRFYGSFDRREQTIEDILKVMSSTGQLNYQIMDGTIILESNTQQKERR